MVSKLTHDPQTEIERLEEAIEVAVANLALHKGGSVRGRYWANRVESLRRKLDLERQRRATLIDRRSAPASGPQREYLNQRLMHLDNMIDAIGQVN